MILFDTSIIIDARDSGSRWHVWAKERIAEAVIGEGAAVNTIVLSEACVRATKPEQVAGLLEEFGVVLLALPIAAAVPAAKAFALYIDRIKKDGKKVENKLPLPDFLIGAHAEVDQFKLATRDPDRIRTYFPKVALICPDGTPAPSG